MEYFAGYGFNKSHSTAYAFLAYQTAYLKANYPRHFAAALLTIEAANTDKLALYITESRERGIAVLPPDINESQLQFSVVPEGVRFGLTAIKGLGEGAIQSILEVRARLGRITSLHQLCESLDLRLANRRVFEALVKSRRLRHAGPPTGVAPAPARPRPAVRRHRRRHRARRPRAARPRAGPGQSLRRRRDGRRRDTSRRLPDSPPWTEMEWLGFEKEALGLYLSGHPVDRHAADLRALGARTVGDLIAGRGLPASTDGAPGRLRDRGRRTSAASSAATAAAQDQEGRPDVRLHPRGSPGRGGGRGVPGDLRPLPAA